MAHPILPLVIIIAVSSTAGAPSVDLNAKAKDPMSLAKAYPGMILIAAPQYPDDDPHGPDPHDENHDRPYDKKLPARDHRDDHKAPSDPYGDQYPNDKKPY